MDRRELQRSIYEVHGPCIAQRITLAAFVAAWVVVAWWLLTGGGIETVGSWFGFAWRARGFTRQVLPGAAFSIYFVRILFTEFVFLKRGVSWSEVFTIALWVLAIYVFLAMVGGRDASGFGAAGGMGVLLFIVGSWMNSYADYARNEWKQRVENRGRLYTLGLFRYSRHPNYLGDLISFSGLCLMAGAWITAVIPALMLAGFVFANIPVLDAHLRVRYGAEFDAYAERTAKLIPFVY